MPKTLLSPMNTFIIPELKPERTAKELYARWPKAAKAAVDRELEKGTRHELEHTPFRYIARIIASHHIWEDLFYYKKLARWHK